MITRDKISFKAAKFPPSPLETDYWIDLTEDNSGNVIKSYKDGEWIPLNDTLNDEQSDRIKELVEAAGFQYNEEGSIVYPDNDNKYFTGNSLVEALENGDDALDELHEKVDDVNEDLQAFKSQKGQPDGLASLDHNGQVPREQLPSYVDDVIDVYAHFNVDELGHLTDIKLYKDANHVEEVVGESDKIYVNVTGGNDPYIDDDAVDDAKYRNVPYQFRWSGTQWVHIDPNVIILGTIAGTAFDGGEGQKLKDTVGSVSKLVLEVTDTFKQSPTDAQLTYMQGVKGDNGIFTYTEHNAVLSAADSTKAGVMTAEMFDLLSTAATIPDTVVSDLALTLNDPANATFTVTSYTVDETSGDYLSSTKDLVLKAATAEIAGLMSKEDYTAVHTTIPGSIEAEKTAREAKDTELEQKYTELNNTVTENKTAADASIKELNDNLAKLRTGVGLEEDYTLPDTLDENSHFLSGDNVESVLGCVQELDKTIYELHKKQDDREDLRWYGVKFDLGTNSGLPDGVRTGNMKMHRELPIQSKMRGCIIDGSTEQNTIKYLNPTDWTKYEDGTAVETDDTGDKNYFVEIPEHYRLFMQTPDNCTEIRISEYNLPGYYHVERKYISAYEVYLDGETETKAKSVKGKVPSVNKTRVENQTAARKGRSTNWNIYTYDAHTDLTWLFVVEYATINSLKEYNATKTTDGYMQGGLGAGVTGISGNVEDNTYSFVPTGTTDEFGNSTGVKEYKDSAHYTSLMFKVPRYRGVENPFGHVWKHTIDIVVTDSDNKVFRCRDYNKFSTELKQNTSETTQDKLIEAGYELQSYRICTKNGFISELVGTNEGDLWCKTAVGSGTTYYCDYNYLNTDSNATINRYLVIGACSSFGATAGLFCLPSDLGVGTHHAAVGTRLTFYGTPTNEVANAKLARAYAEQPQFSSESGQFIDVMM